MGYGIWGIGYDSKLVVVRHEGVGVQLLMEYSYLILEGSRSSNVEGCSLLEHSLYSCIVDNSDKLYRVFSRYL